MSNCQYTKKKTKQQQLLSQAVLKSVANVNYVQLSDKVVNVSIFNRGSFCGQQQQIVPLSHLLRVAAGDPYNFENSEHQCFQELFCHRWAQLNWSPVEPIWRSPSQRWPSWLANWERFGIEHAQVMKIWEYLWISLRETGSSCTLSKCWKWQSPLRNCPLSVSTNSKRSAMPRTHFSPSAHSTLSGCR